MVLREYLAVTNEGATILSAVKQRGRYSTKQGPYSVQGGVLNVVCSFLVSLFEWRLQESCVMPCV